MEAPSQTPSLNVEQLEELIARDRTSVGEKRLPYERTPLETAPYKVPWHIWVKRCWRDGAGARFRLITAGVVLLAAVGLPAFFAVRGLTAGASDGASAEAAPAVPAPPKGASPPATSAASAQHGAASTPVLAAAAPAAPETVAAAPHGFAAAEAKGGPEPASASAVAQPAERAAASAPAAAEPTRSVAEAGADLETEPGGAAGHAAAEQGKARPRYEIALAEASTLPVQLRLQRGDVWLRVGDPRAAEIARVFVESALTVQPDSAHGQAALARACIQVRDEDCARAAIARARKMRPGRRFYRRIERRANVIFGSRGGR